MEHDYDALLWAESGDLAAFLDELDDADFDEASLCEGWRVRDVVSHLLVGHTTPMLQIMGSMLRYRGNVPKGSYEMSRAYGSDHTPDQIRSEWRRVADDHTIRGIARVITKREAFTDHLIHHQDIRRPLNRPRSIPNERLVAALDALPRIGGFLGSKKRMRGLRWAAADVDWTWGEGAEVRGPAEALILAASGRSAALDELSGEGTVALAERTSA